MGVLGKIFPHSEDRITKNVLFFSEFSLSKTLVAISTAMKKSAWAGGQSQRINKDKKKQKQGYQFKHN